RDCYPVGGFAVKEEIGPLKARQLLVNRQRLFPIQADTRFHLVGLLGTNNDARKPAFRFCRDRAFRRLDSDLVNFDCGWLGGPSLPSVLGAPSRDCRFTSTLVLFRLPERDGHVLAAL